MSAKKNLLFCAFFFCLLPLAKASIVDSLGLKKESSKTYIVYKMGNKQPVLSVLKRYNLSLAEFKQANPETDIPVRSGEIVFIPLHYMDESTAVLIQSPKPAAIPVAATATEKKAETGSAIDRRQNILARQDVTREQNRRTPRVLNRALTAAQASEPPVTVGGIFAHVERLERVGEKAAGYAGQMADAEKPGFANRRFSNLVPRGNDGY